MNNMSPLVLGASIAISMLRGLHECVSDRAATYAPANHSVTGITKKWLEATQRRCFLSRNVRLHDDSLPITSRCNIIHGVLKITGIVHCLCSPQTQTERTSTTPFHKEPEKTPTGIVQAGPEALLFPPPLAALLRVEVEFVEQ